MAEDPRIGDIRAELSNPFWADFDNPHVQQLLDSIQAILDREPPAPQVFFPGDTVPAGVSLVTKHGDLLVARAVPYRITGGPAATFVEVPLPSLEEWQAAVDRAKVARGLA